MLHIIGLILKFIGIVFLVILGIVVLLLCTVLFVPIRYEISAEYPGKLEDARGEVKITWLMHLIRLDAKYMEEELEWKLRAAWKRFGSNLEEQASAKKTPEDKPSKTEKTEKQEAAAKPVKTETPRNEVKQEQVKKVEKAKTENSQKADLQKEIPEQKQEKKESIFERIKNKITSLYEKIKYTFQSIRGKIKEGIEIKDSLVGFIEHKIHQEAFRKVKKEFKWIKRLLYIKKGYISVRFGFEDPSLTGKVLAVLSMIYPFMGGNMDIQPEFEEVCLEGKIYAKGRVRIIHMAMFAIRLVLDKNVRRTFKDGMELKDQLI